MSIVLSDIQDALYAWASSDLPNDIPAIWYYPNAPRPPGPYITLDIINFSQVAWDFIPQPVDVAGGITMKGDREFVLTVQAYGGQPIELLENLRSSLQKDATRALLRTSGLVYFAQQPIIDITTLIDSRYEKRASMDLSFRIGQQYSDNLGNISTVELTEEFFDAAEILVFDQTVTIPPA